MKTKHKRFVWRPNFQSGQQQVRNGFIQKNMCKVRNRPVMWFSFHKRGKPQPGAALKSITWALEKVKRLQFGFNNNNNYLFIYLFICLFIYFILFIYFFLTKAVKSIISSPMMLPTRRQTVFVPTERINQSIEAFIYSILESQINVRSSILGSGGRAN